jgi:PAS domain S-box-containing protein
MLMDASPAIDVCHRLTRALSRTRAVDEIYAIALDALADGLGVERASILLVDADGVMRFKAYRRLSEPYRRAVEGHTPWQPETRDPEPIVVPDVTQEASLAPFLPTIQAEGIAAMAFVPLASQNRVIGKFMLYYDEPHELGIGELQLAGLIASQVAFAVARTRAEEEARRSEARLRFALEAASMGTWDWDFATNAVRWSDNLERVHGLPPDTFDGTFASYEREIHPDDRDSVAASIKRAIAERVPHEVEYRIVAPDGTIRWVEGKGQVEHAEGRPVGMTGVCMVVTRRKEAELSRLAALEEAGRLKDEFLATLSHELRTPLNAILGWVEILKSGALAGERQGHAIDVIARNARLQAQLIEDVLDVSRIISGKLEIERLPTLLPQVLETSINGLQPLAASKGLRIVSRVPGDLPPIEGDPKRLLQVFGNVLSNAIKFTDEGGRIEVRGTAAGEHVRIEVRDSGIGIDPSFLPYIFDRFRQADSRSTRKHSGLGLGLAIARHLVQQHRGDIRAHSDGVGCGTTLTIELPVRADAVAAASPSDSASAASGADARFDGRTALVVDDQRDSRELLGVLLEQCGAKVVQCESAAAALEALENFRTDVLVADIAMPEVDGYDLIRAVRQRHGHMPAIAVSAYARAADRARALSSGYQGYCSKPIDAGQFLQMVRHVLRAPAS